MRLTDSFSQPGFIFQKIEEELRSSAQASQDSSAGSIGGNLHTEELPYTELHLRKGESYYRVLIKVNSEAVIVKTFSKPEDFKQYAEKYLVSRRVFSLLKASFMPTHVGDIKHFAEDFFIPTVSHKTSPFKARSRTEVALVAAALAWDLITLPIRALTYMPRLLMAKLEGEHPLYRELHEKLPNSTIEKGEVHIQFARRNENDSYSLGNCGFYENFTSLHDYQGSDSFYFQAANRSVSYVKSEQARETRRKRETRPPNEEETDEKVEAAIKLLNLKPQYTQEELHRAYMTTMRAAHPDKQKGDGEEFAKLLINANEVLKEALTKRKSQ